MVETAELKCYNSPAVPQAHKMYYIKEGICKNEYYQA